jgi:hypothetical protein
MDRGWRRVTNLMGVDVGAVGDQEDGVDVGVRDEGLRGRGDDRGEAQRAGQDALEGVGVARGQPGRGGDEAEATAEF